VRVEEEVERPGGGVSEDIGGEAAVEGAVVAFGVDYISEDADGLAPLGLGGFDCKSD
jgi:hypothetical protein